MAGATPTTIRLSCAGVSKDGAELLLTGAEGAAYTLTVDDTLRAALRGEPGRLGKWETQMDSALRPRDIQARIRAGESPELVAKAAKTTVEAIMPYAGPVLAERAHVADRAQRASLRMAPRRDVEASAQVGGRTLAAGVAAQLRPRHIDPDTVEWDSWRREDGRWMLTANLATEDVSGVAKFAFDAPGNYVTCENDLARWLVGDTAPSSTTQTDTPAAIDTRGVAAPAAPLHEPADLFVADDLEVARRRRNQEAGESAAAAELFPAEESTIDLSDTAERIRAAEVEPARREVTKTKGRASVPSWDEIMFGKGE